MNTLDLALKKVTLKKVASTNGGEWQGPCPECGGRDRFHVWPNQQDGKGSYWCRACEKAGDNIQFLIDFDGMTFKEACNYLNVDLPERPDYKRPTPPQREKQDFTPSNHDAPADLWQEKAEKFITWAQANIIQNDGVLSWLADRGIKAQAVQDFRLGWNPGEDNKDIYRARKSWGLPEIKKDNGRPKSLWIPRGLVIPYIIDGVIYRLRIRRPEGEPRYYVIPGSSMSTMIIERSRRAFVIVESELDAIAVSAQNNLAGAVALGSVSAKPDAESYSILQGALQILNALDYDAAGAKAMAWWHDQFTKCDRWPVPQGKDPGEAFKMGTDLDQWIQAGLPPALTIDTKKEKKESNIVEEKTKSIKHETSAPLLTSELPPPIRELHDLLQKNPGVKIINTQDRFTVLRHGKYVGGRINQLVFTVPIVTDYILNHPAAEIDSGNLII